MKRLGIIDWGIGGISIYRLIKESLGDVPVTYFSDTGSVPYGKMDRLQLVDRLDEIIKYLTSQGVTHIVIGCNAASTALPYLNKAETVVEGVIEPAIDLTLKQKPARLGVIGGRRTILSQVYRNAFRARNIHTTQRIAQPLSALIENGDVSSPELRRAAAQIIDPIKTSSHILLACTHYPAIVPVLRDLVSPQTKFIDPASEMVRIVKKWKLPQTGGDEFLTTGDVAAMKTAAKRAFGVSIPKATKVQ